MTEITSALLYLGVTSPTTPIAERPRASIYADTSMNWQLLSQAFSRLGMPITTAYTTLGEEGLETSLVEPDVEVIFCGPDQVGMVAKVIPRAEKVKWVVYDGEARADQVRRDTQPGCNLTAGCSRRDRWRVGVAQRTDRPPL